jgi:hypothetical protein
LTLWYAARVVAAAGLFPIRTRKLAARWLAAFSLVQALWEISFLSAGAGFLSAWTSFVFSGQGSLLLLSIVFPSAALWRAGKAGHDVSNATCILTLALLAAECFSPGPGTMTANMPRLLTVAHPIFVFTASGVQLAAASGGGSSDAPGARADLALLRLGIIAQAGALITGAMWARMAWGRFWGWDPIECFALASLVWMAAALEGSLSSMRLILRVSSAYTLFGTALVRSGLLSAVSLHGYAVSAPIVGASGVLGMLGLAVFVGEDQHPAIDRTQWTGALLAGTVWGGGLLELILPAGHLPRVHVALTVAAALAFAVLSGKWLWYGPLSAGRRRSRAKHEGLG